MDFMTGILLRINEDAMILNFWQEKLCGIFEDSHAMLSR